jgi:hypothetical protein
MPVLIASAYALQVKERLYWSNPLEVLHL